VAFHFLGSNTQIKHCQDRHRNNGPGGSSVGQRIQLQGVGVREMNFVYDVPGSPDDQQWIYDVKTHNEHLKEDVYASGHR
jgi:hypothetical protein